jgi:uncharacterized protein (DUF4415 family)
MSEKSIKKNLKSKTDWARLQREDDTDIDYSDIPETNEEFWTNAELFMPKHKVPLSLRLDEDIVNFFKQRGKGYQSKINAVLKAYVNSHSHHSKNT